MIIGVDGNEANVPHRVGVSVYTFELLKYFQKNADEKQGFIIYLRQTPLVDLPKETPHFSYRVVKPDFMWSQLSLPLDLYLGKRPDVFFSPAHYSPRISPVPTVVTIHDLAYKFFPEEFLAGDLYKLNKWTEYSVKKASKVICVSNHTKKDLLKLYPAVANKTTVVLNGYRSQMSVKSIRSIKSEVIKPYILFVGTIQPRKNITTLIDAFEEFSKLHDNIELKIVGKKGWKYADTMRKIESSPATDKIKYLGFVGDEELSALYGSAYATVLPSFYEGFGLPVLEAMSHGSPVIVSDKSSLPEVTGDAALLCDPNDSGSIVKSLERLQDDSLRASLIKQSKTQLKQFSWKKCGEETLKVIKSAI